MYVCIYVCISADSAEPARKAELAIANEQPTEEAFAAHVMPACLHTLPYA